MDPLARCVASRWVTSTLDLDDLVYRYIKVKPSPKSFRILTEQDWASEVPEDESDRLTGGTSAITTPQGDILVRQGYEDSAVHELLHASGFMPHGVNNFINEGITQTVAEVICSNAGIPARKTYKEEVRFISRYILPLTGLPLPIFAHFYAKASDKGKFLTKTIWEKYGDKFSDPDEWGSNPLTSFSRDLPRSIGSNPHLEYLVDELGLP